MSGPNTKASIDRLCERRDLQALYELIGVASRDKKLPVEYWLFCRLWEWCRSGKSGIWRYYEGISSPEFDQISRAFERLGFTELAERYREGMSVWEDAVLSAGLAKWMADHDQEIQRATFSLIAGCREYLAHED